MRQCVLMGVWRAKSEPMVIEFRREETEQRGNLTYRVEPRLETQGNKPLLDT